jgi:hypothetical protein
MHCRAVVLGDDGPGAVAEMIERDEQGRHVFDRSREPLVLVTFQRPFEIHSLPPRRRTR